MELKLKEIIEALGNSSGQLFFDKIVLNLASVIGVDYVFIAKLDKNEHTSTTISLAAKGAVVDNFEYDLKDTPCDDVSNDAVCCFTEKITELYPKDQLLVDMNIEAYIGSPLYDSTGKVVGLLVALSEQPVKNLDLVTTLFKLFSGRIAVEMEKISLENANNKMMEHLENLNKTLEKKVESQVKDIVESNLLFETIFETVKDGIAILDMESNFLLANEAYVNMTGYTKEELYKTSCIALTVPEMIEMSVKILGILVENGYYEGYEKQCIRKDNKIIDVRMDLVVMPDKKSILMVTKDITKENKYKKEKLLQEEYLLKQSRLAQMGEMISMIAHQWRQPLSAISTTSMDLQMKLMLNSNDMENKEEREEFLSYFDNSLKCLDSFVNNLSVTIDDFRNFYKPNKEIAETTLESVVSKALSIIKDSLDSQSVKLTFDYQSKNRLKLYENEIMQTILNILKNSQDCFLERNIDNPQIDIKTKGNSIVICDNAGGIPADIIDKIFDPYFSTKYKKNGTGLGLYMSKIIVEEHHNGVFSVANINDVKGVNTGVCFTIELNNS